MNNKLNIAEREELLEEREEMIRAQEHTLRLMNRARQASSTSQIKKFI